MFCSECGTEISDQAVTCPKCGMPLKSAPARKKPIVGIVIGGILSISYLSSAFSFAPGLLDIALYSLVPALVVPFVIVYHFINILGNLGLLVGVGLTALNHQNGPRVVRVTCILMLIATVLLVLAMFSAVSGSLETTRSW